jgi:hypothetical protein
MQSALDNPDASRARALAAQRRQREEFAVGPWSAKYEQLYRDLLAARAGRARA